MALRELPFRCIRPLQTPSVSRLPKFPCSLRRNASTTSESQDVESSSSLSTPLPPPDVINDFKPARLARNRRKALNGQELPPSRYHFRPPKYYRGPLHPHQPPPPSDPASREFIPGPFSLPRLEQTHASTIAPDLLVLAYQHTPPGQRATPTPDQRLRAWDGSSPYHTNRPLRAPRGGSHRLRLLRRPMGWGNIPSLARVTVHAQASGASSGDEAPIQTARMVLQQITGVKTVSHRAKVSVARWGLKQGRQVSVTAELAGEGMWEFVGKVVDVVMPRVKDWKGVKGSSGDGSGNVAWGLGPAEVGLFPEVESNFDA
ncbi:MAG: hypothetical protein M1822_002077 [Bathelium mastoideum]|nr:MAG: hypothetical protein M1822_002077 [Bathelium mastoideum]